MTPEIWFYGSVAVFILWCFLGGVLMATDILFLDDDAVGFFGSGTLVSLAWPIALPLITFVLLGMASAKLGGMIARRFVRHDEAE